MALQLGGELPFEVRLAGYSGQLQVEPLPPVRRRTSLDDLPEFVLPTARPPQSQEAILEEIEREHLVPQLDDEFGNVEENGKFWDLEEWPDLKYYEPSVPSVTVSPVWKPPFRRKSSEYLVLEGRRIWCPESEQVKADCRTDPALAIRKPGNPQDFVRGNSANQPFRPGGLAVADNLEKPVPEGSINGEWLAELYAGGPMQKVAPGLKRGLDLGSPQPFSRSSSASSEVPKVSKKREGTALYEDMFRKAWEEQMLEEEQDALPHAMEANNDTFLPQAAENEVVEEEVEEETVLDKILSAEKASTGVRPAPHKKDWVVMDGDTEIAEKFADLVPDMAISFPFELDKFQKEAIYHLERNESVFVAAHTSAGKTVVAEYAFALAAKHCTRAVYTSPIKTISNQKYRDFSEKFDVGLLTGDVSIRPEASCLIMTTEILRSMLYKGADIVRDIEWVIFDEVHYVNDAERGVVWEEVIIMLPEHVNLVLLSATVPNVRDFADWVGRTKQKKIYVTGTNKRPVPLEHCLFYSGEIHKICENEVFLPEGVKAAKDAHLVKTAPKKTSAPAAGRGAAHSSGGKQYKANKVPDENNQRGAWRSEASQWYSLVNLLSKKSLLPVVVFCFSKNRCDQSADSLTGLDLTTSSEKSEIRVFCNKAFARLKGTDRQLPQVAKIEELLRRGIGAHHAGLLPIVKEVVEMLFCRGVIKVLFSTETFAMGVNAPARTVAFHSLRKHDGRTFRELYPGEYTQMAGRAGRRGLDKVGTVVVMCWDQIPDEGDLRRLLTGKATKLESQFRLTYTMILNLLRVEELKVEDMLKRSFAEFHAQRALPEQQQQLLRQEAELSKMAATIECILGEPSIEEYYKVSREADVLGESVQEAVMQSRTAQQSLAPGRIVTIKVPLFPIPTMGVVLRGLTGPSKTVIVLALYRGPIPSASPSVQHKKVEELGGGFYSKKSSRNEDKEYSLFAGAKKTTSVVNLKLPHYGSVGGVGYVVLEASSSDFSSICKEKIRVDANRLLEEANAAAFSATIQQLLEVEEVQPSPLDPLKDLKLNDIDLVEKYKRWQSVSQLVAKNKCHRCPKLQEHYAILNSQQMLKDKVDKLRFEVSDHALQQMPEFHMRMEVLREIGCIDADLIVQLKGRVTCEMNTGDELIATECLFDNQLAGLDAAEAVALLSSLVFQQRDASEPMLTPNLSKARERIFNTAIWLGELQVKYQLVSHSEDYARNALQFGLMEVVYEWAKGTPFSEICEMTNVSEGLIVRTIVRLDETCREVKNAARLMGNTDLVNKMDEASNLIKRDIVFAASLYVAGVS